MAQNEELQKTKDQLKGTKSGSREEKARLAELEEMVNKLEKTLVDVNNERQMLKEKKKDLRAQVRSLKAK